MTRIVSACSWRVSGLKEEEKNISKLQMGQLDGYSVQYFNQIVKKLSSPTLESIAQNANVQIRFFQLLGQSFFKNRLKNLIVSGNLVSSSVLSLLTFPGSQTIWLFFIQFVFIV